MDGTLFIKKELIKMKCFLTIILCVFGQFALPQKKNNSTKVNTQENKTNQNLNAKEESLVKISSLTATGNLESLKVS
jgi:hypothetical protein